MPIDFSAIVRKRVPYVPYVRGKESNAKSVGSGKAIAGHTSFAAMSAVSISMPNGHAGHGRTPITLEALRNVSECNKSIIIQCGHAGHDGHVISDDDVEFFYERAAIAEYDGGLSRADAEVQAFAEWQALKHKILH